MSGKISNLLFLGGFDKNCDANQGSHEMNIFGMDFILKFLTLFGSQVEYLVYDFCGSSEDQGNLIFSCVTKYCINLSSSLKFKL